MKKELLVKKLIDWYHIYKRPLPWRETVNPYYIWLSEVILQQTRVAQGLPYYHKFVQKYPTILDLARTNESEILSDWQGLGYYSRAKNLHSCAKEISTKYDGKFPENYEGLLKLRGIGRYTAAAIASFAFKQAVPVVDGNVNRFISRFYGIMEPINSSEGEKKIRKITETLICTKSPDIFNQAIMEFGALQCTPSNPNCSVCIFSNDCLSNKENLQSVLPIKIKKVKSRKRYFNYLVFVDNHDLLFSERTKKDIWSGLYDFPLIESDRLLTLNELLEPDIKYDEGHEILSKVVAKHKDITISISKDYKHVLTHQKLFVRFFRFELGAGTTFDPGFRPNDNIGLKKVHLMELETLPKPVLISNYLKEYF